MTTRTLLTPVSILATGGGADLDVSRLIGPVRVTRTSLNTAGTNPTLADKLQGSTGLTRGYEYSTTGTNTDNKLRTSSTVNTLLGLKFTQSGAASIKRVALKLKKNGTITAGKKLTLAIQTDTTGSPSGTVVQNGTSATVDIDTEVTTSNGWVVFTFAKPVDLSDATVYHLVLSGDYTADTTNNVTWQSTTVASGGTLETKDNTSWAAVTSTEKFLAYVDQYSFSDITGGGFTALATAGTAAVETLEFNGCDLPAFMRLYSTIGGTSNPAWASAATVSGARVQEQ